MKRGPCLVALIALLWAGAAHAQTPPPNFVVFFLDDAGWADMRPFGQTPYPTPSFERLAREGRRFSQFYVPQAICSASRAALMTGCYPGRTKVTGALPPQQDGLGREFATLAEALKPGGYATAIFGKWHLGDTPESRPNVRGFDESAGLMVSNDMWPGHPENPGFWGKYPLQYFVNGEVTIPSMTADDQRTLTRGYTERAIDFVRRHAAQPFFLYVPHSLPHVPLFCSPEFEGKSGTGRYGDVMMEIDWSLGQILDALDAAGVAENTLVLFTSDNGPWSVYGNHAGKTPFREAKGTSYDGGVRSPCIVRWPGHLEAGSESDAVWSTIDVAPTLLALAGLAPRNEIDGRDVWPLVRGDADAGNPHAAYFFSTNDRFEALVSGDGRWKLQLPHNYRQVEVFGADGAAGKYRNAETGYALYDLDADPYETTDVQDAHPEVLRRLLALAEQHRATFYAGARARD